LANVAIYVLVLGGTVFGLAALMPTLRAMLPA
jgi:hypothetical protein